MLQEQMVLNSRRHLRRGFGRSSIVKVFAQKIGVMAGGLSYFCSCQIRSPASFCFRPVFVKTGRKQKDSIKNRVL